MYKSIFRIMKESEYISNISRDLTNYGYNDEAAEKIASKFAKTVANTSKKYLVADNDNFLKGLDNTIPVDIYGNPHKGKGLQLTERYNATYVNDLERGNSVGVSHIQNLRRVSDYYGEVSPEFSNFINRYFNKLDKEFRSSIELDIKEGNKCFEVYQKAFNSLKNDSLFNTLANKTPQEIEILIANGKISKEEVKRIGELVNDTLINIDNAKRLLYTNVSGSARDKNLEMLSTMSALVDKIKNVYGKTVGNEKLNKLLSFIANDGPKKSVIDSIVENANKAKDKSTTDTVLKLCGIVGAFSALIGILYLLIRNDFRNHPEKFKGLHKEIKIKNANDARIYNELKSKGF